MNNTADTLNNFVKYNPAVASQALTGMLMTVQCSNRIEDGLDQNKCTGCHINYFQMMSLNPSKQTLK